MNLNCVLVGAAAAACVTGTALADSVNVTFDGIGGNLGQTVGFTLSGGLHFADGSTNRTGYAGQLSHTVDGVSYKTYCTELTQWAGNGVFEKIALPDAPQPGSGMGQTKADAIYRLYNATNLADDIDTSAKAAAFQAVIWEVIYDFDGSESDISLASGKLAMTGVDATLFSLYSSYATGTGNKDPHIIVISNNDRQDQILSVPLPGAAAMAGLGMLGLVSRRRRA